VSNIGHSVKGVLAVLLDRSCCDFTSNIGHSLDLVLAEPACEGLQFKGVAAYRVRRAPGQAHDVFAFGTSGGVGGAKASWHGVFLFFSQGTNLPLCLAFQTIDN
jgi:hypothetical protein